MTRPDRAEILMEVARLMSLRATCSRAQVGVVIAQDFRPVVTGYNGTPAGMPHCHHFNDQPCTEAVHAEANAISFAARHGLSLERAHLFTTVSPCIPCAQLIIQAGIIKVSYDKPYRDSGGVLLLRKAGVETFDWSIREPPKKLSGFELEDLCDEDD